MAKVLLTTTKEQDEQRKRLYQSGITKKAIHERAIEIGLNKMIADLDRVESKK